MPVNNEKTIIKKKGVASIIQKFRTLRRTKKGDDEADPVLPSFQGIHFPETCPEQMVEQGAFPYPRSRASVSAEVSDLFTVAIKLTHHPPRSPEAGRKRTAALGPEDGDDGVGEAPPLEPRRGREPLHRRSVHLAARSHHLCRLALRRLHGSRVAASALDEATNPPVGGGDRKRNG